MLDPSDFHDTTIDAIRAEFPELIAIGIDMQHGTLRYSMRNLTNHSMRVILVGLWLRLDMADRVDHIAELQHYLQPGSQPPGLSLVIATAGRE